MATVDLFLDWGQSNMLGRGLASLSPATTAGMALEWVPGTGLIQLADPTSSYQSNTGCCLPAFANAFTAASARPAVFSRSAVGGTPLLTASKPAVGSWGYGGARYTGARDRSLAAVAGVVAAGHTVGTVNLLWHQGETDAASYPTQGTLTVDYKAALIDMFSRARADISSGLTMYVLRVGKQVGMEDQYARVQAAQDQACAETAGMVMAYTRCVDFPSLGWMNSDGLHYNQTGQNDMGTTAGVNVALDHGYVFDTPPPTGTDTAHTSRNAARMLAVL